MATRLAFYPLLDTRVSNFLIDWLKNTLHLTRLINRHGQTNLKNKFNVREITFKTRGCHSKRNKPIKGMSPVPSAGKHVNYAKRGKTTSSQVTISLGFTLDWYEDIPGTPGFNAEGNGKETVSFPSPSPLKPWVSEDGMKTEFCYDWFAQVGDFDMDARTKMQTVKPVIKEEIILYIALTYLTTVGNSSAEKTKMALNETVMKNLANNAMMIVPARKPAKDKKSFIYIRQT